MRAVSPTAKAERSLSTEAAIMAAIGVQSRRTRGESAPILLWGGLRGCRLQQQRGRTCRVASRSDSDLCGRVKPRVSF
jgi:hypothetical protein